MQIIRPIEQIEQFMDMLSNGEQFLYLQCLQISEIEQINVLTDKTKQEAVKIYCALPAASLNREGYYRIASRVRGCHFSFYYLWNESIIKTLYKQQKKRGCNIICVTDGKEKLAMPQEIQIINLCTEHNEKWLIDAQRLKDTLCTKNTICLIAVKNNFYGVLEELVTCYPECIWIDYRIPKEVEKEERLEERWTLSLTQRQLSVTVICTLYKRPDNLIKQLKAIQNQSLSPAEILLFQDGIQGDYTIRIADSLKNQFQKVEICSSNEGVWGRFRFARTASSKYICIFDDDTIPGSRWLENCHFSMLGQEGVYGTIGILFHKYNNYPYSGYCRIGWANPNDTIRQVDFVGHSWFVKKKYLEWMFEGTEKYQALKYVAEDMCLSVKCLEHDIHTFVPEHPRNNTALWGSLPEFGNKLGISDSALSLNTKNHLKMQKAVENLVKEGWRLCYMEDKAYVKGILRRQLGKRIVNILFKAKQIIVRYIREGCRLFQLKTQKD